MAFENGLQNFYNSFRAPQAGNNAAALDASTAQIPQIAPPTGVNPNGVGRQYLNNQLQLPGQPAPQGSPLANYLMQVIQKQAAPTAGGQVVGQQIPFMGN